jgi:hypothetical protein
VKDLPFRGDVNEVDRGALRYVMARITNPRQLEVEVAWITNPRQLGQRTELVKRKILYKCDTF